MGGGQLGTDFRRRRSDVGGSSCGGDGGVRVCSEGLGSAFVKVKFGSGMTKYVNSDRGFGVSVPGFSSRNRSVKISPTNLIEIVG